MWLVGSALGHLSSNQTSSAPKAQPTCRSCGLVFLVLFGVAIAFACYTQHVWEDFYITYRAAKNLATGHGLTFTVGERVHSFTSPLGTLLPALASLLTGNRSDTAAIWIFRLMSIAAYAGGGVILWRLGCGMFRSRLPAVFLVAMLATDAKIVDFTVNGMETPYLLLFLFWTLYALFLSPSRRAVHLGLAWAGMMWSRPDSFVYIGALGLGVLLFGRFTPFWGGRRDLLRDFLVAGAIMAVLYAPWVLWAWRYYGSPIPHTIIAKGLLMPSVTPSSLLQWLVDFPFRIFRDGASLGTTFLPPYGLNSGWPRSLIKASFFLSLVVFLVWLIPLVRWEARVASFAFAVGHFYLNYFARFHSPWYVPTLTVLAFVAIAGVIGPFAGWSRRPDEAAMDTGGARRLPRFIFGATLLLPLGAFLLLLCTGFQMRMAQAINETGNRLVLAEWLKANASTPKDTVFLECLGYIGYCSNLKMYDFPGLCSPEVVAVRRRSTTRGDYIDYFPEIISALGPDWVVLRSSEEREVDLIDHELLTRYYRPVRVFDTRARINAIPFLPGRDYLLFDSHFAVYHRNPDPAGGAGLRDHVPIRLVPITVEALISRQTWAGPAYDSGGYIAAHAPSLLTVRIPAGARAILGQFGFFPGAYEKPQDSTHGATFTISVVSPSGNKTRICATSLSPRERQEDRGSQSFDAAIPAGGAALAEFTTEPLAGKSNAYGWTYWTNLYFEIQGQ